MTSEEFQNLRTAFEHLCAAAEADRPAILSHFPPLQAEELSRMLAAHSQPTSILDRPASAPQAQIGPYLIEKELGIGGMGVVYLASRSDGSFDRKAAIKVLRRDRIGPLFLSRFQQERQILAQLNHPHIASIWDAGETTEGDPYFVMEFVDGLPITTYCDTHRLSIPRRLDLFLQVCDAVQYAHRNLTVHRDLKPGNVLVTEAGAAKLLDFGIAKWIEPNDTAATTAVLLTPDYSSPEQIRREPVSTSADVFALGILLYELLTGVHPFRGKHPHEVMRAICEDDPPAPKLPSDLAAIILTSLRKQPAWRYPSVEQMAEDIRRYRAGLPVTAKSGARWYLLRKFVRRHWLTLAAALLLVLSLVAGTVSTLRQAQLANEARAAAERERQVAEQQKLIAQQSQRAALAQQAIAEARTRDAEAERAKAQQRYREVRSLASSMLFDLYDGVRDLAGSATARRLIVSKVQTQLEILNHDGGNDLGLQRDLAASYERMGELRIDPRNPTKTDAAAALESYRQAVTLRQAIAGRSAATPHDRSDLALSLSKLADGEFLAADSKNALLDYQRAWDLVKDGKSGAIALGSIDERRCIVLLTAGDSAAAIKACQEGIATLAPLASAAPGDIRIQALIANIEASYANALRLSSQPAEAEPHARRALESLQRLEQLAPNNAEFRRLASTAETILANTLASLGKPSDSLEAYQRAVQSMQVAILIDPSDGGSALRLAVTLLSLSRKQAASGNQEAAHNAARSALQLLQVTAERPGAGAIEWNEYADALLKMQWPDLRAFDKALTLAQKAAAATARKNPFILDTLAWALYRNGDAPQAASVEREALALLPANAKGGIHDELANGLKTFLAGAK